MVHPPNRGSSNNDFQYRQTRMMEEWTDSFNTQVSTGVRNQIDIPSAYDFNPERLRYFKNGTRIKDANDATFTDQESDFLIEPTAGDVCRLQTAERPRYVVGFDSVASAEAQVTSTLGTGDTVRIGIDDDESPENAAFFEINGDSANRLVIVKSGSEVKSQEFTFPDNVDETNPIRYELAYNWYGVGTYRFTLTYTDDSREDGYKTVNELVGEVAVDDEKSTDDSNFHIFHEIDATTSGQSLEAGSYGYNVLGEVGATRRTKVSRIIGATDNYSGTGNYEPIAAARIDPDRGNIFCQLNTVECVPSAGDGELLAVVVDDTQTDATGFDTPPAHSAANSVIEETTNVTTFPDEDGNIVTDDANPNGYQVGFFSTDVTGQGATQVRTATPGRQVRPIYEDDVVIFLYKADTATARTVNVVYSTVQLW